MGKIPLTLSAASPAHTERLGAQARRGARPLPWRLELRSVQRLHPLPARELANLRREGAAGHQVAAGLQPPHLALGAPLGRVVVEQLKDGVLRVSGAPLRALGRTPRLRREGWLFGARERALLDLTNPLGREGLLLERDRRLSETGWRAALPATSLLCRKRPSGAPPKRSRRPGGRPA